MRPLILLAGLLGVGACFVIGGIAILRPYALADQCSSNLKQIGLALHNYHDVHKCFPPACYTDQTGKAIHSWRILALAFLEQNTIYDAYRFDEPWNSANNYALGRGGPPKFPGEPDLGPSCCWFCPLDPESSTQQLASYAAIVGPGTAFSVGRVRRLAEFRDGSQNTIMVAEIDYGHMHWLEPRDLDVETMSFRINDQSQPGISSRHAAGPAVLFADGCVLRLSPDTPAAIVKALITVDGGEPVTRDELIRHGTLR